MTTPAKKRGFAAMDPKLQHEAASQGGKAAHRYGRAHQFTPEEARAAGLKGAITRAKKRAEKKAQKKQGG